MQERVSTDKRSLYLYPCAIIMHDDMALHKLEAAIAADEYIIHVWL
jgi:hypothetical protein